MYGDNSGKCDDCTQDVLNIIYGFRINNEKLEFNSTKTNHEKEGKVTSFVKTLKRFCKNVVKTTFHRTKDLRNDDDFTKCKPFYDKVQDHEETCKISYGLKINEKKIFIAFEFPKCETDSTICLRYYQ